MGFLQNSHNYDTPVQQNKQKPDYGRTNMQMQNQWSPQPTQPYEYQPQPAHSLAVMKEIPSGYPSITVNEVNSQRNREEYRRKPDNTRNLNRNYSDRESGKRSKWNEQPKFDDRLESTIVRGDNIWEGRHNQNQPDSSYRRPGDNSHSGNNQSSPRFQHSVGNRKDHTSPESNEWWDKYHYVNPTLSFINDAQTSGSWKDQTRQNSMASRDYNYFEKSSETFRSGPNNSRSWKDQTKPDSNEFRDNYQYENSTRIFNNNTKRYKGWKDHTKQDSNVSRDNYHKTPPRTFSSDPNNSTFKKPNDLKKNTREIGNSGYKGNKRGNFNDRGFSIRENENIKKSYLVVRKDLKPKIGNFKRPEDFEKNTQLNCTRVYKEKAANIAGKLFRLGCFYGGSKFYYIQPFQIVYVYSLVNLQCCEYCYFISLGQNINKSWLLCNLSSR